MILVHFFYKRLILPIDILLNIPIPLQSQPKMFILELF